MSLHCFRVVRLTSLISVTYCLIAVLLAADTDRLRNTLKLVGVALLELSVGR